MPLNLSLAAQNLLAQVQAIFGSDNVTVTSGKSSRVGVAGGSKTSQHPSGNAFDFKVKGYNPDQVQSIIAGSGISFGQSIQEYGAAAGAGLNHLGVGSKGQLLTGRNGKYSTTGYAASTGAPEMAWNTLGDYIKNLTGINTDTAGGILSAPGDAINSFGESLDPSAWFARIAFGVLAILLIGVALFMLAGKPAIQIAGKLPPIPV